MFGRGVTVSWALTAKNEGEGVGKVKKGKSNLSHQDITGITVMQPQVTVDAASLTIKVSNAF